MTKKTKNLKDNSSVFIGVGLIVVISIFIFIFMSTSSIKKTDKIETPSSTPSPKDDKDEPPSTVYTQPSPTKTPSPILLKSLRKLVDTFNEIKTLPTQITSTYGKTGKFFISGQASLPDKSDLVEIGHLEKVTSVLKAIGLNENETVTEPIPYPPETTVFSYDPVTSKVVYYKGTIKISELKEGPLTIGSVNI